MRDSFPFARVLVALLTFAGCSTSAVRVAPTYLDSAAAFPISFTVAAARHDTVRLRAVDWMSRYATESIVTNRPDMVATAMPAGEREGWGFRVTMEKRGDSVGVAAEARRRNSLPGYGFQSYDHYIAAHMLAYYLATGVFPPNDSIDVDPVP